MTKTCDCDQINELGQQSLEQLQNDASSKQANRVELMGELLRSKGFIWLATSNLFIGGWQQAGNILKIALIGKAFWILICFNLLFLIFSFVLQRQYKTDLNQINNNYKTSIQNALFQKV